MMAEALSQGDVWDIDFGEVDEQTGKPKYRASIVISRSKLNMGQQILVVPTTGSKVEERKQYLNNVFIKAGTSGLTKDCVAQTHLIAPAERAYFIKRRGRLTAEQVARIIQALFWTVDYHDNA